MKNNINLLNLCCIFFINSTLFAQITDPVDGKDVYLRSLSPNTNYGTDPSYGAQAWTNAGNDVIARDVIEFDISSIPSGAIITDAKLSLYQDLTSSRGQHSTLSGSNVSWLQRITSPWDEMTVTWNTQPTTDTTNQVTLPESTSPDEDYLDIDVTALVQDMIDNPSSGFGFMIRHQTEIPYRRLIFASSDNSNPNLYPKIKVIYLLNCFVNSGFTASSTTICEGDTINFINNSSGALTYEWKEDSITFSTNTNTSKVFSTAGTYIISLIADSAVCSDSTSVVVTVNPLPPKPTITPSGNDLASSSAMAYQWYYYDTLIIGATLQFYTATKSGFYSVMITDANDCSSTSDPFSVTISAIADMEYISNLNIYPNPNPGEFTLELESTFILGGPRGDIVIIVFNVLGQAVYTATLNNFKGFYKKRIDLKQNGTGIYNLQLITDKGIINKKIIIE